MPPAPPLRSLAPALHGYVPDGMTAAQYAAVKKKEKASMNRNFGQGGVRGFKSRSFASFHAALEKGEAQHLMPVDPSKVRSGEIKLRDVPYMQRGGSWNNDDLTGKKGWMKTGFGMTALEQRRPDGQEGLDED